MAWLQRNRGHMEERKSGHLDHFQLGSVESIREPLERAIQCLVDRFLASLPDSCPRIRALQTHEVPPSVPDHSVELCRGEPPNNSPVVGDRFLARFHTMWKNAFLAQENRMQDHACALFDTVGTSTGFRSDSIAAAGAFSKLEAGCSLDF